MQLTERYDDALLLAAELHRAQVRKGSGVPYLSHLLSVSALVMEYGGDEDQAIAALLHDAAEDQGGAAALETIRQKFGDDVRDIVADCTDTVEDPKPAWRPRKEAYIAGLAAKRPRSLLVSLADKTHNATTILHDHRVSGEALWDRFTGGRDGTLWYYRALADRFAELLPGALADRFQEIVAAMAGGAERA